MFKTAISRYISLLSDTHRGYRVWPKFEVDPSQREEFTKLLDKDGRFTYKYIETKKIGIKETDPLVDILDINMKKGTTAKTKPKDDDPWSN